MDQHDCPFCRLETNRIRLESEFAVAFLDGFPVTQGHTLVIPKRHIASLFELPAEEQEAVWAFVAQVRAMLLTELRPDVLALELAQGLLVASALFGTARRARQGPSRKSASSSCVFWPDATGRALPINSHLKSYC